MQFQQQTPMLWTAQLKETIDFYVKILGFTIVEYNEDWDWAALHRDSVELMFAKPNEHTPFTKPAFTGSFYIKVDEVDELWAELKDKAKICYDIDNFEHGMREFAIYDNNGYTLQFGKEIV